MSVDAVKAFWKQVATDKDLQATFIEQSNARIVAFAADHGFAFTAADLQSVADATRARVAELQDELDALGQHELDAVAGGVATTMSSFDTNSVRVRIGEVLNLIGGRDASG